MGALSKVSRGLGVAGAGLALLMLAGPAYAAGATDGTVVAAVTGTVAVSTTPCTPNNPLPPAVPSRAGTVGTFGDVAIATIAITGEGFDPRELKDTAEDLRKKLYRIPGISKVELHGGWSLCR